MWQLFYMQQVNDKGAVLSRCLAVLLFLALIAGCSTARRGEVDRAGINEHGYIDPGMGGADYAALDSGQAAIQHSRAQIRSALKECEKLYAQGIVYYQKNELDSSQLAFGKALELLADIDIDGEQGDFSEESRWAETLLKEIKADYELALMASGEFFSEGSANAFRELFSDIKNFKSLKEKRKQPLVSHPDLQKVSYDVPITFNEKVENSLIYLQTVAHDLFEKYLGRSARYIPLMSKILEEEGLPHDIVYLPLIESGFNTHAYSYAKAMGPWQFIASTGKRYGLDRNWWYDERRDFEKSTRAACRYLKDLYNEFQSWELALASYNGGEGRVRKEIARKGTRNFWKLNLKKQTRDYVPLFMAAVIIAKEPQKYGFNPVYEQALEWETVEIDKCISFKNIQARTGISVADLEFLNPEILRGITPPNEKPYRLRLPVGYKDLFLASYEEIPSEKVVNFVHHTVRKGETLSRIAAKHGVTLSSIMSANNLGRNHKIYAGQSLIIPKPGLAAAGQVPAQTSQGSAIAKAESKSPSTEKSPVKTYTVKKGDTLGKIAQRHGVTVSALKRANNLRHNVIHAGRKLKIPGNGGEPAVAAATTHIVRNGDSLHKIALKYGVTVESLKRLNRLNSSRIYPRMVLKIPETSRQTRAEKSGRRVQTYRIKRGDTLSKIADLFEVTVEELIEWNRISNPHLLRSGDRLNIYAR